MLERHTLIPASYLLIERDNKILLLRRYNTGYEDGKYSLVAGHVEKGETFVDCIIREAYEEAGITIKASNIQLIHVSHRIHSSIDQERIDLYFRVTEWEGDIMNKEPHKCDDLSWFEMNNVPDEIIPNIRLVLDAIRQGLIYSDN